jgi:hypothetical protein
MKVSLGSSLGNVFPGGAQLVVAFQPVIQVVL